MSTTNSIFTLQFPEAKNIIVSGDIHGDFNLLVNKLCVQYEMKDTVLIVAGDCGFGFEQKGYYENIVRRNSKRMNNANNWIVFVRAIMTILPTLMGRRSITKGLLQFLIIQFYKHVDIRFSVLEVQFPLIANTARTAGCDSRASIISINPTSHWIGMCFGMMKRLFMTPIC